ncbi:hypothetical protein [Paenibacillus sp. FSL H8-0079]|uniref:hypothetical protein n=1 Tax=Paenibacillus sp. FSL H8-0079 TaxID=2921375 RepID=UPI0030EBDB35
MDKSTLLELSKKLDCQYEIGIWSETMDFMERQENVESFSLFFKEEQYNLRIQLRELNRVTTKEIFNSLVQFLQYNSTFYVREDHLDAIHYYFLSSTDAYKAFIFHVVIN